jgi:hypothetical protein
MLSCFLALQPIEARMPSPTPGGPEKSDPSVVDALGGSFICPGRKQPSLSGSPMLAAAHGYLERRPAFAGGAVRPHLFNH